ncbi:MAG: universal stress protein [Methylococcaceae bacterium]
MSHYQHILVAIDYSAHSEAVTRKAKALAESYQTKLSLVHILDNIPMPDTPYGTVIPLDEDSSYALLEAEKVKFLAFAEQFTIEQANCWLIWGIPKQEIVQLARQEQVDLIVIGSHGRHGLALLLGSTANSVLHYSDCDVLAVRLQDK